MNEVKLASQASQENFAFLTTRYEKHSRTSVKLMKKNFDRNDVEARASVRTPSYAPAHIFC